MLKKNTNERRFPRENGCHYCSMGLGLSLSSFESSELKKLTILHTNDVHSHIDPFPADDPRNQIWAVWREELH
jgi:5'-nucleotidase